MTSKFFDRLNPAQNEVGSGSAAIDYSYAEEKPTEHKELMPHLLFPLGIPSYKNQDLTSDWFLAENIAEDTYKIEEIPNATAREKDDSVNIIHIKPSIPIETRFIELQEWECCVIEIRADSIVARLIDLTNGNPDEEAEFSKEEIDEEDFPLVIIGAIFRWSIGYLENKGQRIRASLIRFRRLPAWRKEEIEAAEKDAERLRGLLNGK